MDNLKDSYERTAGAFGIEDKISRRQAAAITPIAAPVAAFWGIMDFFVVDVADALLGVKNEPIPRRTHEEIDAMREQYIREFEEETNSLKEYIFESFNTSQ